jgi:TetR/AcrR family transcriptional regulator, tetracycline repressor protein
LASRQSVTDRPPLTRERVLTAALHIIDQRGLDELTMRGLGAELGVEAMSIYKHVPGKGAVLDGVVELLLDELETTLTDSPDWRIHLTEIARRVRALSCAHPSAFPLLRRRSLSAYTVGRSMTETALRTTMAGGFDADEAICAVRTVLRFTFGFALADPRLGADSEAAAADAVSADLAAAHPLVHALIRSITDPEPDDRLFEFGLAALIRGLEPRGAPERA